MLSHNNMPMYLPYNYASWFLFNTYYIKLCQQHNQLEPNACAECNETVLFIAIILL